MAGNIEEQPALRLFPYQKVGSLPNAHLVHNGAFFIGIHHGIGSQEREAIVNYFDEFMSTRVR
jgi:hypothetical protein